MKQKSTKLIAFLLAFTSLTMGLASCEKDSNDQDPTPASIEGLWIGSYAVDGYPGAGLRYFSFIIKPDGTVINDTKAENQQHLSIGSWTLTGDLFECTATCVYGLPVNMGVTETHTATFDKANGTMTNGVWKNVPPLNGSGTFTLTKVE